MQGQNRLFNPCRGNNDSHHGSCLLHGSVSTIDTQTMMVVVMIDDDDAAAAADNNNRDNCGARWLIGRYVAFRPKGRWFESHSSRHVGTLGKSFTRSCLWRFGVKFRHSVESASD